VWHHSMNSAVALAGYRFSADFRCQRGKGIFT
jgi:hypothetical protein